METGFERDAGVGLSVSVDGGVAVGAETLEVPLEGIAGFLVEPVLVELPEPPAEGAVLVGEVGDALGGIEGEAMAMAEPLVELPAVWLGGAEGRDVGAVGFLALWGGGGHVEMVEGATPFVKGLPFDYTLGSTPLISI